MAEGAAAFVPSRHERPLCQGWAAMSDPDLDDLRAELDEFAQPEKKGGRSPREERIIAGFEEIQRFAEQHGCAPQHGEDRDIFERLYAVRLDRLRALEECRTLLAPLDRQGLLKGAGVEQVEPAESMSEDELRAELEGAAGHYRHHRAATYFAPEPRYEAAEEVAKSREVRRFRSLQPLFKQAEIELTSDCATNAAFRQGCKHHNR